MANMLLDALAELFTNTPQGGQGLLSPQNIGDVMQAPVDIQGIQQGVQQIPDQLQQMALQSQFGQNLPPAVGNQQSGANIAGRALGGIGADIQNIDPLKPFLGPALPEFLRQPLATHTEAGRQFSGAATGINPQELTPDSLQKQITAGEQQVPTDEAVMGTPEKETGDTKGKSNLFKMLTQLGIPLATAGIGMGVPGALAGASGFMGGYTGQQETMRKEGIAKQQKETDAAFKKAEFNLKVQELAQKMRKDGKLSGSDLNNAIKALKEAKGFGLFGGGKKEAQGLIDLFKEQWQEAGGNPADIMSAVDKKGNRIISADGGQTWSKEVK